MLPFKLRPCLLFSIFVIVAIRVLSSLDSNALFPTKVRCDAADAGPADHSPVNFTFPTVQERIKYYMGSWYDTNRTIDTTNTKYCGQFLIFKNNNVSGVTADIDALYPLSFLQARHQMTVIGISPLYLRDAANVLTHIETKIIQGNEVEKLVLAKFGDSLSNNTIFPLYPKQG